MPGARCTTCITFGVECRYDGPSQRRPAAKKRNAEELEARLEFLENALREMRGTSSTSGPSAHASPETGSSTTEDDVSSPPPNGGEDEPEEEDEVVQETLSEWMQNLEIDPLRRRPVIMGQPSSKKLINSAFAIRSKLYGEGDLKFERRMQFWETDPRETEVFNQYHRALAQRRYNFPDEDLVPSLIDKFFDYYNSYVPLLHKQTFTRSVTSGLHLRDNGFAATFLLVCALGSKYSDDPRVKHRSDTSGRDYSGWNWFEQIRIGTWPILAVPRLYDVQVHVLAIMYSFSFSLNGAWLLISHGLKMVIDAGAHRKNVYSHPITLQEELWKRAFWSLLYYDRLIAPGTGRPYTLQEEDFDVDWPIDCNDEYWELGFKQPSDVPSKMTYFLRFLKLLQIQCFALRMLSGVKASRSLLGLRDSSTEQQLISEINTAMNKWLDSLPEHLLWDPKRDDLLFLSQSAILQVQYNHLQIVIHRPYIARNTSSPAPESLEICVRAASRSSRIFGVLAQRIKGPFLDAYTAFSCAVILVLTLWNKRAAQTTVTQMIDPEDITRCLNYLHKAEIRNMLAGQLADVVEGLVPPGAQRSAPSAQRKSRSPNPSARAPETAAQGPNIPPVTAPALTPDPNILPLTQAQINAWIPVPPQQSITSLPVATPIHDINYNGLGTSWPSFERMLDTFSRRDPSVFEPDFMDAGATNPDFMQARLPVDPMAIWANSTTGFETQDPWLPYMSGLAGVETTSYQQYQPPHFT